jgi:hypothetical protein
MLITPFPLSLYHSIDKKARELFELQIKLPLPA